MAIEDDVRNLLDGLPLPPWIARYEVEAIVDYTDHEALRITLFVHKDHDDRLSDGKALGDLSLAIHRRIQESGISRWPYVHYDSEVPDPPEEEEEGLRGAA